MREEGSWQGAYMPHGEDHLAGLDLTAGRKGMQISMEWQ
jgi:hypothetical protein